MATGQPNASPKATISPGPSSGEERPGTADTPARSAAIRDEILSPITSMADGGGPTNVAPRSVTARAKSVFSEKNP